VVQDNVAFDVMGHTYFFEDGVETGSTLVGNLGMLTRVSNAMLNTDTTPATFWVRPSAQVQAVAGHLQYLSNISSWRHLLVSPRDQARHADTGLTDTCLCNRLSMP
jgi:hypothetical protein